MQVFGHMCFCFSSFHIIFSQTILQGVCTQPFIHSSFIELRQKQAVSKKKKKYGFWSYLFKPRQDNRCPVSSYNALFF